MTGPAVASLKLLAQATGEYTREELNKVAKLGWAGLTLLPSRLPKPRLPSWAVALRQALALRQAQRPQAVAQVAEARLVAALTLAATIRAAVARPSRAKATNLKTTETQRHREFCAEIQKTL